MATLFPTGAALVILYTLPGTCQVEDHFPEYLRARLYNPIIMAGRYQDKARKAVLAARAAAAPQENPP